MIRLVFFLEERSAEEAVKAILPRIIPGVECRFIPFDGKNDLKKELPKKLRGWKREPGVRFIVLTDQDNADCRAIKKVFQQICEDGGRSDAMVRIACRELESWYLADLRAVETGLKMKDLSRNQFKKRFRNPDELPKPSQILKDVTNQKYQKISGSRAIAPHLDLSNTRSPSFKNFIRGIRQLADEAAGPG